MMIIQLKRHLRSSNYMTEKTVSFVIHNSRQIKIAYNPFSTLTTCLQLVCKQKKPSMCLPIQTLTCDVSKNCDTRVTTITQTFCMCTIIDQRILQNHVIHKSIHSGSK